MSTKKASAANGGKNQNLERDEAEFAITAASLQDNICFNCAHFAAIRGIDGLISYCDVDGETVDPQEVGCGMWRPVMGMAGLDLTVSACGGNLAFPKTERLADGLCNAPHCSNSGLFYFMPFPCRYRHEYKLAATRPVTVRAGGLSVTGERVAVFLFKIPNTEVSNV